MPTPLPLYSGAKFWPNTYVDGLCLTIGDTFEPPLLPGVGRGGPLQHAPVSVHLSKARVMLRIAFIFFAGFMYVTASTLHQSETTSILRNSYGVLFFHVICPYFYLLRSADD